MKRQKSCLILFLFYGGYMLDNQLVMTTLTLTSVFTLLRTHLCNEKGTYPSPGRSRSSSPRGTPSPSRVISTLSLPTSEKQFTSRRPPIANFRWKTGKPLSHPPPPHHHLYDIRYSPIWIFSWPCTTHPSGVPRVVIS